MSDMLFNIPIVSTGEFRATWRPGSYVAVTIRSKYHVARSLYVVGHFNDTDITVALHVL